MRGLERCLGPRPDSREKAVLELLDQWPWAEGGVVIGGYALAAYGRPRYSEDIDIVVPFSAAGSVESWLRRKGFELERASTPNPQNFDATTSRYSNGEITLDLLVGAVRDREAKVDVPADWICMDPRLDVLRTLSGKTSIQVPVARLAAMWLLKLQAGRDQDITDLFAIFETRFFPEDVRDELAELRTESLVSKLHQTLQKIRSTRLYRDSLSRLQMKQGPASMNAWRRFGDLAQACIPLEWLRRS